MISKEKASHVTQIQGSRQDQIGKRSGRIGCDVVSFFFLKVSYLSVVMIVVAVRACVRACVRAYVRACERASFVHVHVHVYV